MNEQRQKMESAFGVAEAFTQAKEAAEMAVSYARRAGIAIGADYLCATTDIPDTSKRIEAAKLMVRNAEIAIHRAINAAETAWGKLEITNKEASQ